MRHIAFFLGCLICLTSALSADYNDFETNTYILPEARERMRPYLLLKDHPAKAILDRIFHSSRASFDDESLISAGFKIKYKQPRSFIRVVSHPKLNGYLLKIVTDVEMRQKNGKPDWHWFVNRCVGVKKIQDAISQHKIKYFVAPKKWIYPLPIYPYPENANVSNIRKIMVLLVEDMNLTSKEANLIAWKTEITKKHLDELYLIIKQVGGRSYRASNIPQTKQGTFAFIDTEYPRSSPDFNTIRSYLSSGRRSYWDKLVEAKQ